MVDAERIKRRMEEVGVSQKDVADGMGLAQSSLSLKINGKRPFFLDEAWKLAEILKVRDEFFSYFFSPDVAQRN